MFKKKKKLLCSSIFHSQRACLQHFPHLSAGTFTTTATGKIRLHLSEDKSSSFLPCVFLHFFFFKQVNMQVKSSRKIINGEMLRYASRTVLSLLYHSNLPNNYNFSLIKNNTLYFLCLHLKVWKTTFMVE